MINSYIKGPKVSVLFCPAGDVIYNCFIDTGDLCKVLTTPTLWRVNNHRGNYVSCYYKTNNKRKTVYLHRFIMDCPAGKYVDHIDGNPLNNRRSNLRIVTHKQNCENKVRPHKLNTSGFRGVSYHKHCGKWEAYYWDNYIKVRVGFYNSAEEANEAVCKARADHLPYSADAMNFTRGG